jgi:hypothetical protein
MLVIGAIFFLRRRRRRKATLKEHRDVLGPKLERDRSLTKEDPLPAISTSVARENTQGLLSPSSNDVQKGASSTVTHGDISTPNVAEKSNVATSGTAAQATQNKSSRPLPQNPISTPAPGPSSNTQASGVAAGVDMSNTAIDHALIREMMQYQVPPEEIGAVIRSMVSRQGASQPGATSNDPPSTDAPPLYDFK